MPNPQAGIKNLTYRDPYGDGARNPVVSVAPSEQISSINEITAKNLYEAKYSLVNLLSKVRGVQPSTDTPPSQDKDRNLTSDACTLRSFSFDILNHLEELHRVIGSNS